LERWNRHCPEMSWLLERATSRDKASSRFSYKKKWARGGKVFRWMTLRLFQSGGFTGIMWGAWGGPGREDSGASAVGACTGRAEAGSPGRIGAISVEELGILEVMPWGECTWWAVSYMHMRSVERVN
jgi:hypothetical protein